VMMHMMMHVVMHVHPRRGRHRLGACRSTRGYVLCKEPPLLAMVRLARFSGLDDRQTAGNELDAPHRKRV
jgi:hypothetical protein